MSRALDVLAYAWLCAVGVGLVIAVGLSLRSVWADAEARRLLRLVMAIWVVVMLTVGAMFWVATG